MMSETMFTGMVVLFWVAELAFGALVAYWFITQGFDSDAASARGAVSEMEDRSSVLKSLAMWGLFFVVIVVGIAVGA